jgi:tripartite-type tricarboxylate transporter receptor subunit TctC
VSRLIALALGLGLLLAGAAQAQTAAWPVKPVRLLHGFGAGGNADIVTRLVAEPLAAELGQPVIVDARTGAGGNIASEYVARQPADGYTLVMLTGGHAVSAAIYRSLPFDPVSDFSMISTVTFYPLMIGVASSSPFATLGAVIEAARRAPGKLTFSSVGVGSTQHLAGELFAAMAGIKLIHVPYRGGSAPVQDAMSGQVDLLVDTITAPLQFVRSGRIRALAVTSRERSASLPEVPPVADSVPGFDVTTWMGAAGPARLPPEVQARLHEAFQRVVARPDLQRRLAEFGGTARSSTPAEMARLIDTEVSRWKRVVAQAQIERQ